MASGNPLMDALAWMMANPMYVFLLYVIYNIAKQKLTPFPEAGGRTKGAHTTEEFYGMVADAKKGRRLLVADFYATWCPPCRAAAPIFGRMSEKWAGCDFVKVDVDELQGVSRKEGVQAMPTFKIYKDGACTATIQGFNPAAIETKLAELGASAAAVSDKDD